MTRPIPWRGEVEYAYDAEGNLLSRSGDTEEVSYTYDAMGRVESVTDGRDNTTSYTYDDVGNITEIAYPEGDTIESIDHDEAGRVLERVDGNDVHTEYEYNGPQGQLTKIHYPATQALDVTFTYTDEGYRASMTDATGVTTWQYDELGLPLSVTTQYTGLPSHTIGYAYYPDGSRQSMTLPKHGGGTGTIRYSYDKIGRPVSLTTPDGKTARWQYDLKQRRIQQTLGNRAWTRYTYNNRGELARLTNHSPKGRVLSDFTDVQYDAIGNRTQYRAVFPGLKAYSGVTTYSYDAKSQLLQEQSTRAGGYTRSYEYDDAGDPTLFAGVTYPDYNDNNQLDQTGYVYDDNGNPTRYHGDYLTFDAEDRLTEYEDENQVLLMSAGYNGAGLRTWKEGDQGRTYLLYDGKNIVAELDAEGDTQSLTIWGLTGLLARNGAWYQYDLQGDVVHRLDAIGKVLSTNLYDAWGNLLLGGVTGDPYGYRGQSGYYFDVESEKILCTYRYYDMKTGRWLSRDPIGYDGGINLYSYVNNKAVNMIDYTGLDGETFLDGLFYAEFDYPKIIENNRLNLLLEFLLGRPSCSGGGGKGGHHSAWCGFQKQACDRNCAVEGVDRTQAWLDGCLAGCRNRGTDCIKRNRFNFEF